MKSAYAIVFMLITFQRAYAVSGVGPSGVDAAGLQLPNSNALNGGGIGIGQVEFFRPGKAIPDGGPDSPSNSARAIVPAQIYMDTTIANGDGVTVRDIEMNDHAEQVASIMISTSGAAPGVAPGAMLYSSGTESPFQRDMATAANFIATRNAGDISAINLSFGLFLVFGEDIDGTSHLTRFIDWSADRHDVLYVIAGREFEGGLGPVPSDNFNGITVGGSTRLSSDTFMASSVVNDYADDADGDRVSLDLLAPSSPLDVVHLGGGVNNQGSGTSIAAPHVTGAVALLQQYGKYQIDHSIARWVNASARRHQVMKAILLNSADKISGVHGSERTIINSNAQRWHQTLAYADPGTSLDEQMGAGHLNVSNALTNYQPGEYAPGDVPLRGWDYGSIGSEGAMLDYDFTSTIPGKTWVAVTLAWDRLVQTTEVGNSNVPGSTEFFPNNIFDELTNLDLHLVDSMGTVVASSNASADSVEHIFFRLGANQGGDYTIRVENAGGGSGEGQSYGLAWWVGDTVSPIPGDFNDDGVVDDDDLAQWRGDFGINGDSDADGDGFSDGDDFLLWQRNLGTTSATPTSTPVPEPAAWLLFALGLPLILRRRAG